MSTSVDLLIAVVAVALGGAAGASLRYVVETWTVARWGRDWPWGTLAVNLLGSLLLGAALGGVVAAELPRWALLVLATGFCGALTTFSSFALQILDLSGSPSTPNSNVPTTPRGFRVRGLAYAGISLGVGLLAAISVPTIAGLVSL